MKLFKGSISALLLVFLFLVVTWQPALAVDPPGDDSMIVQTDSNAPAVDSTGDAILAKYKLQAPDVLMASGKETKIDNSNCPECHTDKGLLLGFELARGKILRC